MFRIKRKFPDFLVDDNGVSATAASKIVGGEESWIAAWPTRVAVVHDAKIQQMFEWYEIETASWDEDKRIFTMTFVDSEQEPIVIEFAHDANESLLTMIHERVERSIVCQGFAELPSGGTARGQVRRRADETLFVQIIVDRQPSEADLKEIGRLEAELRDLVGLDS